MAAGMVVCIKCLVWGIYKEDVYGREGGSSNDRL